MDKIKAFVVEFAKKHKVSLIAFGVGVLVGAVLL